MKTLRFALAMVALLALACDGSYSPTAPEIPVEADQQLQQQHRIPPKYCTDPNMARGLPCQQPGEDD